MKLNNFKQKAAMFGLDARIALVIFSSLGVITGVSLYSMVKQSRVSVFMSQLHEISKAVEQYRQDTGSELPIYDATGIFDTSELVDSAKYGWDGPYLTADISTAFPYRLEMNIYGQIRDVYLQGISLRSAIALSNYSYCTDTVNIANDCQMSIIVKNLDPQIVANLVDLKQSIDGNLVWTTGSLQLIQGSNATADIISDSAYPVDLVYRVGPTLWAMGQ